MATPPSRRQQAWIDDWLESVTSGRSTMSQRKLDSLVKRAGTLRAVTAEARRRKVHLLLLEDDKGNQLVAASMKPFKVLTSPRQNYRR